MPLVDRRDHFGLVGPEPDVLSLDRQEIGQRRAPAARAKHGNGRHGGGALAALRPKRFSVPLRRR